MFYDVHLLTMNTSLVPSASLRSYSYETQFLSVRAAYLIHTVTQDILKFSQIFRISCEFQTISGGKRISHSSNRTPMLSPRVWLVGVGCLWEIDMAGCPLRRDFQLTQCPSY